MCCWMLCWGSDWRLLPGRDQENDDHLLLCRWADFKRHRWKRSWSFPLGRLISFQGRKGWSMSHQQSLTVAKNVHLLYEIVWELFTTRHPSNFLFVCQQFWNPSCTQSFHIQLFVKYSVYCDDTTIRSFLYFANCYSTIIFEQLLYQSDACKIFHGAIGGYINTDVI